MAVMQEEYKKSMERISLSEADKARILKNAKKAYEQIQEADEAETKTRPLFSVRKFGAAAAACIVLAASAFLMREQFHDGKPGVRSDMPVITQAAVSGAPVEVWQEYESIADIEKYTDCKTYKLEHISKDYKVKKVEVANEEHHVKITYKNKKARDKVIFEYKEEEHSEEITAQFQDAKQIKKEKVEDSVVTMYGEDKCEGMSWEKESCTFSVRMTKPRSTKKAMELISATVDAGLSKPSLEKNKEGDEPEKKVIPEAVGWHEEDFYSGAQSEDVLNELMERQGFCVKIKEPAEEPMYKIVDDFESFTFVYMGPGVIEGQRIIGYAGWEGCPDGVMKGYTFDDMFKEDGVQVYMYKHKKHSERKMFSFKDKGVSLTLLVSDFEGEHVESLIKMLREVLKISSDKEDSDSSEKKDETNNASASPSAIDSEEFDGEKEEENYLNSTTVTP